MLISLLARLTPACNEVAALSSQSMDRRLPLSVRVKLRLHYWICAACARYRDQLLRIRRSLRSKQGPADPPASSAPTSEARDRLVDAFRAKHR